MEALNLRDMEQHNIYNFFFFFKEVIGTSFIFNILKQLIDHFGYIQNI